MTPDPLDHDAREVEPARRRFEPRDDVPPERQTHERVSIPDPGTTYRPQHFAADWTDAMPEPESEGGEE